MLHVLEKKTMNSMHFIVFLGENLCNLVEHV
jgi:hypothetical protein